jgi:hypothetical protein
VKRRENYIQVRWPKTPKDNPERKFLDKREGETPYVREKQCCSGRDGQLSELWDLARVVQIEEMFPLDSA